MKLRRVPVPLRPILPWTQAQPTLWTDFFKAWENTWHRCFQFHFVVRLVTRWLSLPSFPTCLVPFGPSGCSGLDRHDVLNLNPWILKQRLQFDSLRFYFYYSSPSMLNNVRYLRLFSSLGVHVLLAHSFKCPSCTNIIRYRIA